MIIVARDAKQAVNFYMELKRKLTEYIKRLTGKEELILWEKKKTAVIELLSFYTAVRQISYLYANPAKANLSESINDYPGLSSWSAFKELTEEYSEEIPWVRPAKLKKLPALKIENEQDKNLTKAYATTALFTHKLILHPFAWIKCFGGNKTKESAATAIRTRLDRRERHAAHLRTKANKKVIGLRLCTQPLMKEHVPQKRLGDRKIFFMGDSFELRIKHLEQYEVFDALCRRCFEDACRGEYVVWPPGAFIPPLPPMANALF